MAFKPLNDRILVQRTEVEEKTAGGIIIPDNAKEKPMQGRVISVGAGKSNEEGTVRPLEVKPGNTILFRKYAGSDVTIDGKEHLILREDEVLAIVNG